MAITSSDIQNQSFKIERRGYDVDEVDVFLERVASEIDDLNDEIARLRVQVKEAASASRTEVISERPAVASDEEAKPTGIDPALVAERRDDRQLEAKLRNRKSDDTAIAQALIVAQRTADEIVSKAKADVWQTPQNAKTKVVVSSRRPMSKSRRSSITSTSFSSQPRKGSRAVPGYAEGIHRLRQLSALPKSVARLLLVLTFLPNCLK